MAFGYNVIYAPPSNVPTAPANVPTITATSMTDPARSDTDAFAFLTGSPLAARAVNESLLNGRYAILLQG